MVVFFFIFLSPNSKNNTFITNVPQTLLCLIKFSSTMADYCLFNAVTSNEFSSRTVDSLGINPLNPELNPICYLLALLGAHHLLHVSRIRVKLLTFRLLMSFIYIYIYIYGAPILDVSRSHTTTQHSR